MRICIADAEWDRPINAIAIKTKRARRKINGSTISPPISKREHKLFRDRLNRLKDHRAKMPTVALGSTVKTGSCDD